MNERIVGLYDGWLESAELTQNMALQYWLDFKYITAMCNVATTVNTERNKKVAVPQRNNRGGGGGHPCPFIDQMGMGIGLKTVKGPGGLHQGFLEIDFLVVSDRESDSYQKFFAK